MKFSEQWLRTWVNPQVSRDELVARLSMAGLEVDSVTPAAGAFSGVVVGEILSAEQHPAADKLRVCQVSNGSGELLVFNDITGYGARSYVDALVEIEVK